jgi:cytochrome c oxidase cbb3-type subunit III
MGNVLNWRALAATALVLTALVLGGALECWHPRLTEEEAHGRELYGRMCAVCHGKNGEGYAADQAPALAHPQFRATASDEFLIAAITEGRKDTTMSAWGAAIGGPLDDSDVNALLAYMRRWPSLTEPVELDESPLRGNRFRGARIFERECVKCHGTDGKGGPNVHIGNPQLLRHASNGFLRHAIRHGRDGAGMPGFAETLSDVEIDDVVAFVRSHERPPPPPREARPKPDPIPLGPVPLNPSGPDPQGFMQSPKVTKADHIYKEFSRGAKMAFLDAREPTAYVSGHIKGAVSVPFYAPEPYFEKLPRDAWLVSYCACPHAESRTLAQKLRDAGFQKVTILDEGLGYWRKQGYPTGEGREP